MPVIVPYFYDYISGYSKNFTGVRVWRSARGPRQGCHSSN